MIAALVQFSTAGRLATLTLPVACTRRRLGTPRYCTASSCKAWLPLLLVWRPACPTRCAGKGGQAHAAGWSRIRSSTYARACACASADEWTQHVFAVLRATHGMPHAVLHCWEPGLNRAACPQAQMVAAPLWPSTTGEPGKGGVLKQRFHAWQYARNGESTAEPTAAAVEEVPAPARAPTDPPR